MSRVKPGYFTVFNAFFICSSEIDIRQFTAAKPRAPAEERFSEARQRLESSGRLAILVIHFVADLIFVAAGEASRLLVGFCHEVWLLPLRPSSVVRLHWVRRSMEIENPLLGPG